MTARAHEIATEPTFSGWPLWKVVHALEAGACAGLIAREKLDPANRYPDGKIPMDVSEWEDAGWVEGIGFWPWTYRIPIADGLRADTLMACACLGGTTLDTGMWPGGARGEYHSTAALAAARAAFIKAA
jgi:hypothetical protein